MKYHHTQTYTFIIEISLFNDVTTVFYWLQFDMRFCLLYSKIDLYDVSSFSYIIYSISIFQSVAEWAKTKFPVKNRVDNQL